MSLLEKWAGQGIFPHGRWEFRENRQGRLQALFWEALLAVRLLGFTIFFNYPSTNISVLVSEVLDKSGETSYLGFKLLAYYLMFISSMSLGIIAGANHRLFRQHIKHHGNGLKVDISRRTAGNSDSVIATTYQNAVTKYDLGKKTLRMLSEYLRRLHK